MKYLSLFSGIGGFELGLENAEGSFENIGYSEIDPFADTIYSRWFPNHRNLGDASQINPKDLQDFELLVAGFPCQAFSIAGYQRGFEDTRGTLFFEIARICEEKLPKYLLLENVKGLLSHNGGRTFKRMLEILNELGYDVEWQIFNSKSFGTAQNRERLYIKGYSRERCGGEILSATRICGKDVQQGVTGEVSSAVCGSAVPKLKSYKFKRQVKKRIHKVDENEFCDFLRTHKRDSKISISKISSMLQRPITEVEHWFRKDEYFSPPSDEIWYDLKRLLGISDDKYDAYITEYEWVDGVFEQDKRAYDENGLAPTLTTTQTLAKINVVGNLSATNHHGDDVHGIDGLIPSLTSTDYKHYKKIQTDEFRIRRLTPVECERLQAFPDGWTQYGKDGEPISDTQRYRCLGNAVTTTVVTYIANTMFGEHNVK